MASSGTRKDRRVDRESLLAPWAARASRSRGRLHPEPESATRSPFQRDRDRIIHSTAFRRLEYKTQVFVYHEGDHYRTRLTHSLEVAQITRSAARLLGLDEDLAEACALAHDLGHPPFGHAGEETLDRMMADFGGFDHNAQTIRLVTELERRYAAFPGLNLTFETLEGLAKHNGPLLDAKGEAKKPIPFALAEYARRHDLALGLWPGVEAQIAAMADDIAYTAHDIDDGLRAGLFAFTDIVGLDLVAPAMEEVAALGEQPRTVRVHELVRRLIDRMVGDLVSESRMRLERLAISSIEDVRRAGAPLVDFSASLREALEQTRAFLHERMYRNRYIVRGLIKGKRVVEALFDLYIAEPHCMPAEWEARCDAPGTETTARAVADFIAGMTDRYALREYRKLFEITEYPT
ncbi:MAG: deoxyguanosinetriphosphate triphosphohydrolase [Alphaproteobacteria bacterium]|nr:MAG: deoxyguanosinetriphosphate triphosphohydrolase [Alphaproteobacteria bacterium]